MQKNILARPWGVRFMVTFIMALSASFLSVGSAHATEPQIIQDDQCGTALDDYMVVKDSPWAYRYDATGEFIGAYGVPISTNGATEIKLTAISYHEPRQVSIVLTFTGSGESCVEAVDAVTFRVGNCVGLRGYREAWVDYTNVADSSGLPKDRLFVSAKSNSAGIRIWDASYMGSWADGQSQTIQVHSSQTDVMNSVVGYYPGIYRVDVFANGNMSTPVATGVLTVPSCGQYLNEDTGPPGAEAGKPKATLRWLKQGRILKVTFDTPAATSGVMEYRVVVTQGTKSLTKRFQVQAGTSGVVKQIKTTRFTPNRTRKAVVSVKSLSSWTTLERATLRVRR